MCGMGEECRVQCNGYGCLFGWACLQVAVRDKVTLQSQIASLAKDNRDLFRGKKILLAKVLYVCIINTYMYLPDPPLELVCVCVVCVCVIKKSVYTYIHKIETQYVQHVHVHVCIMILFFQAFQNVDARKTRLLEQNLKQANREKRAKQKVSSILLSLHHFSLPPSLLPSFPPSLPFFIHPASFPSSIPPSLPPSLPPFLSSIFQSFSILSPFLDSQWIILPRE